MNRLQHSNELFPEAVLEGDPIRVDPARHEQDLFMLHVDAFDRADTAREVEGLQLAEGLGRKPSPALLPDHRRVEALLDGGPDREGRTKGVAIDYEVATVPNANLVDRGEEHVRSVSGEDV